MNDLSRLGATDARVSATATDEGEVAYMTGQSDEVATAGQTLQNLLTPDLRSIHRAPSQPYELMLAEVLGEDEYGYVVVNLQSRNRVRVKVAVGCLVEPSKGDLVQVFANRHSGWITMTLHRSDDSEPVILTASGRALELRASKLSFTGTERVSMEAPRIEERATLKETTVQERATTVLGSDNLHTGSANWNVEGHLGMHSRTQLMTADSLMKINGGQIHMA